MVLNEFPEALPESCDYIIVRGTVNRTIWGDERVSILIDSPHYRHGVIYGKVIPMCRGDEITALIHPSNYMPPCYDIIETIATTRFSVADGLIFRRGGKVIARHALPSKARIRNSLVESLPRRGA
jgi:hypothetical protein